MLIYLFVNNYRTHKSYVIKGDKIINIFRNNKILICGLEVCRFVNESRWVFDAFFSTATHSNINATRHSGRFICLLFSNKNVVLSFIGLGWSSRADSATVEIVFKLLAHNEAEEKLWLWKFTRMKILSPLIKVELSRYRGRRGRKINFGIRKVARHSEDI